LRCIAVEFAVRLHSFIHHKWLVVVLLTYRRRCESNQPTKGKTANMALAPIPSLPQGLLMCLIRYKMDRTYRNVLCEVDPGTIKEEVWFLEPMVKVNKVGKKQERTVVITDRAVYNFKSKSFSGFQRRISLHDLARLLVSDGTLDVVVQPIETLAEYDYHFVPRAVDQRERFVSVIQHVFYKLLGESLIVVSRPMAELTKLIMTKASLRTRSLRRDSDVVMTRRARARAAIESGYQVYTRQVPAVATMPTPILTSPPPLPSSPHPAAVSMEGTPLCVEFFFLLLAGLTFALAGHTDASVGQVANDLAPVPVTVTPLNPSPGARDVNTLPGALDAIITAVRAAQACNATNTMLATICAWNCDTPTDGLRLAAEAFLCLNTQDDVLTAIAASPLNAKLVLDALSFVVGLPTESVGGDLTTCLQLRAWAIRMLFVLTRTFKRRDILAVRFVTVFFPL
jgi:hypothetical protein